MRNAVNGHDNGFDGDDDDDWFNGKLDNIQCFPMLSMFFVVVCNNVIHSE